MKILNGSQLAEFIKERQARQVRALRQAHGIELKLAIIQAKDDPVIDTYVRLKEQYGADIGIEVAIHRVDQRDIPDLLSSLNRDDSIHGIIVQLPLEDTGQTDEIVRMVDPHKDVDALGQNPAFSPATPTAILWLLAGYNVDLKDKSILLVGKGKLVGAPLEKMLKESDYQVEAIDRESKELAAHTKEADVVITATGSPAIIYSNMIKQDAVVVDAGVASESGKKVGDLDESVYERDDLTITPKKGGVGPLTVCALFENVIQSALKRV